jgi:hypothetical protein
VSYFGHVSDTTTRTLAIERSGGPRRKDESPEAFEERVAEHMPRAEEPLPTPDAISARNERRHRALRPGTSA